MDSVRDEWLTVAKFYNDIRGYKLSDVEVSVCAERWFEQWFRYKGWMNAFLGDDYRVTIPLEKSNLEYNLIVQVLSNVISSIRSNGAFSYDTVLYLKVLLEDEEGEFAPKYVSEGRTKCGMSIGKFLLSYAPKYKLESDRKRIEQVVNDSWSYYAQSLKVNGTLQLSARPLDLVLMSEHGIRSCMGVCKEYPWGSLSYAVDAPTLVAFVTDDDNPTTFEPLNSTKRTDFTYQKKVWRELVYLGTYNGVVHHIKYSRQYPQDHYVAHQTLANWLNLALQQLFAATRVVELDYYGGPQTECLFSSLYTDSPHKTMRLRWESPDEPTRIQLNHSTQAYSPSGSIQVGSSIPCVLCGVSTTSSAVCPNCRRVIEERNRYTNTGEYAFGNNDDADDHDGESYCAFCEEWVNNDYISTSPNGDLICDDCASELLSSCEHCGESVFNEDTTRVMVTGGVYGRYYEAYWCGSCVDNLAWSCDGCNELYADTVSRLEVAVYNPVYAVYAHTQPFSLRTEFRCPTCYDTEGVETCENCGDDFVTTLVGYEVEDEEGLPECPTCRYERLGTLAVPVAEVAGDEN